MGREMELFMGVEMVECGDKEMLQMPYKKAII